MEKILWKLYRTILKLYILYIMYALYKIKKYHYNNSDIFYFYMLLKEIIKWEYLMTLKYLISNSLNLK